MLHTIKVSFTDGNEIVTKINGSSDTVIEHYQLNNLYASKGGEPQATRIEFIESPILETVKSFVYLFIDYDHNGLLS